jgi:1,2-diacylglycerol 3-beta-glucosyltransferase
MNKKQTRVLIVEDDLIQTLLLENVLYKIGCNIVGKAQSGSEAIEKALKLKPDVITMDIMLSDDVDGIQAATEIQKNLDVDLIYISGNKDHDTLERASKTKYIAFLRKPFNMQELKEIFLSLHA